MSFKISNPKWYQRLPLTVKMAAVTVLVGIAVWAVLDHIQSRRIKDIFIAQLTERLGQQAMEDRLRFDRYVKSYQYLARLFVTQKKSSDYIEGRNWQAEDIIKVKYYTNTSPWFPGRSMLHTFSRPHYVFLIDLQGNVREVYHRSKEAPPRFLHSPSRLLIDKSHRQSYMTTFEDTQYLVTSDEYIDSEGKLLAVLMIAAPIDDSFLNASIGGSSHRDAVALLTPGESPQVITSSNLQEIPPGTALDALKDRYLITGKEFFDYGSSDLVVRFASFISMTKVSELTRSLIMKERSERAIAAFVFILVFTVIMFWVAQRIQRITGRISDFSQKTLGLEEMGALKGDQLSILEERFQLLTEKVVRSREIIKKQAEEKTRLIVNNAFDAIITMGADGIITTWNPQAEAIFGWKKEDAVGRKMFDLVIPPRYRKVYSKGVDHFLATGSVPILDKPLETAACHRRGDEFPVEITVSHTESGNEHIFIAIIRDISERKKLEEAARLIQAKLIHANKMTSLGMLVSGVVHEINNPNSFIMSNAQLFNDIWEDVQQVLKEHYGKHGDFPIGDMKFSEIQDQVPELLASIGKGTDRIKNIVDTLKNFARPDTTGLDGKVDVKEIAETAVLFLNTTINQYTNNFQVTYGDNIPYVKGSARQLEQVVINLLMNSLQSLDNKSREVRVSIYHDEKTNVAVIRVKDEGRGIPKEIIDRVTEPFFTTKLDKGGTGLGLSISYAIIKDHNGSMGFHSETGKGTIVCVKLPVLYRKHIEEV